MEILGLGVDICEIERMERALGRHPAMRERVFTPEERAYLGTRPDPTFEAWEGNGVGPFDVAVGMLARDVPGSITPATIADRAPQNGDFLTSYGYGCNVRLPNSPPDYGSGGGVNM